MRSPLGRIYCQRCRAANSVADEACAECGTRLMLVVEPTGLRFEDSSQVGGAFDEHLLERISLLENNLSRVIDKLEKTLDLMLKQAQSSYTSHSLLDALISTLAETGALNRQILQARWRAREGENQAPPELEAAPGSKTRTRIVETYEGEHTEAFISAVSDGFEILASRKPEAALIALLKAVALDPKNAALNRVVGLTLIVAGRPRKALDFLVRAAQVNREDPQIAALLGLAFAEDGDDARALELLNVAAGCGISTFSLHLALGRVFAARGTQRAALAQYKLAVERRECPEAYYLLGQTHLLLGHTHAALRHLRRAVALDDSYSAAWELMGRALNDLGETVEARKAFNAARRMGRGRREIGAESGRSPAKLKRAGRVKPAQARKLVTSGDARLSKALGDDLLDQVLSR